MKLNEQIRKDLEVIGGLIANSSYFFDNLEYLLTKLSDKESVAFNGYPFLKKVKITLWSLALLDIHKVLSNRETDKFRFLSILNRIENNYKRINWEHKLSKEKINELMEQIMQEWGNIERIMEIRDKRIAHYDNNATIKNLKISELKRIISLSQNIYNCLSHALYNSSTIWSYSQAEMVKSVVNSLTRFNNIRELGFTNLSKQSETIKTSELMKLIRANC